MIDTFPVSLNVNVKVDPSLGTEVKPMNPSNILTIFSDITRPSPIPFLFLYALSFTNPKSLNNLLWSSNSIPAPVSITSIWMYCDESCSWIILTLISTFPFSVNLIAFDYNPSSTCWILYLSVLINGLYFNSVFDLTIKSFENRLSCCVMFSYDAKNWISSWLTFCLWIHITCSIASLMLNYLMFFLNFPALI